MKTFFKILGWTLLLILLGGLIALLVWWRHWPWWVGLAMFAGVAGLILGVLALRAYFRRRKEREFVQRVIAQDTESIHGSPTQTRQRLVELQEHWLEAIELLKSSYLKKQGNPLYVLPWFMVIGESGAGKTSAIKSAGLHSQIGELRRASSLRSTRNCDWWFFDQAIVLDTAGRYTIPIDEGPDREEWTRFLTLVAQYRKKEPLNGVIVVIPADQLLTADATKLNEDAQDIRRRLDHLMRSLGSNSPVYILVTKLDRVHGMAAFCEPLGERAHQAMGFTNLSRNPYWKEVLDQAMGAIQERLSQLRLVLAHLKPDLAAGALLFPSEFSKLHPALELFLRPLFEENPYLETPPFRGLFFSSARRGDGATQSEFLATVGLDPHAPPPADRGLFLRDFFGLILPRDRHLFKPIKEFLRWQQLTQNLALVAWFLLWVALLGFLGLAYQQNLKAIGDISRLYTQPPTLTQNVDTNLLLLDRMRIEIQEMELINRRWWIPRFGLNQSRDVEIQAKAKFAELFRRHFLSPMEESSLRAIESLNPQSDPSAILNFAGYLVPRIQLHLDFLAQRPLSIGQPPAYLSTFQSAVSRLVQSRFPNMSTQVAEKLGQNYYAYFIWYEDPVERQQKLVELRKLLSILIQAKPQDLSWLTLNWLPGDALVKLETHWGDPSTPFEDGPEIPAAYTIQGRMRIQAFMKLMDGALSDGDRPKLRAWTSPFWAWYRDQLYAAWHDYLERFPEGESGWTTAQALERMATTMTTPQNPYFNLIHQASIQMNAFEDSARPKWVLLLLELDQTLLQAESLAREKSESPGLLANLKNKEAKIVQDLSGQVDPSEASKLSLRQSRAKVWNEYLGQLKSVSNAIVDKETAFKMMAELFPSDFSPAPGSQAGGGSQNAFVLTHANVARLGTTLPEAPDGQAVLQLARGPLNFLVDFCIHSTSQVLQEQWREQVLGGISGAEEDKIPKLLFGRPDGLISKFLEGTAKPFVTRGQSGYFARSLQGNKAIPFTEEFLGFLKSGAEGSINTQSSYTVSFESVPLEVNKDAQVEPYGSQLCLQCADPKKYCLDNYNYPQSLNFIWEPEACGDVTLSILFPKLTLVRTYRGRQAFPRLLEEFETGSRIFYPREWPDLEPQLKALNIQWIRLTYKIRGAEAILRYARRAPSRVPHQIVQGKE